MRPQIWLLPVLLLAAAPVGAAQAGEPTGPQWVEAELDLAAPDIRTTHITGSFLLRKAVVGDRSLTSEEMAREYGRSREAFALRIEDELRGSFAAKIEELFPGAARSIDAVVVDRASLGAPRASAFDPPVRVDLAASVTRTSVDLGLAELPDSALAAVFAAGAVVTSRATLHADEGMKATYTLHAPTSPRALVFASAPGGDRWQDGTAATFVLDNTRGLDPLAQTVELKLRDAVAKAPAREDATVEVVVDLKDVDTDAGRAVSGALGTLHASVTIDTTMRALRVPAEFTQKLGGRGELEFVSSDAIRIALANGFIDNDEVTRLEQALVEGLSDGLSLTTGAPVEAIGWIDRGTLAPSLIAEPPSTRTPLEFHAEALVAFPLGSEPSTRAAVSVYTIGQTLDFPRIRGYETTYTVILPRGLTVSDLQLAGGHATRFQTEDGRDAFRVTPSQEQATATMSIGVGATFVLAKFWPLVLLAVVLLVLVVGSPVALVVLRGRRKAK